MGPHQRALAKQAADVKKLLRGFNNTPPTEAQAVASRTARMTFLRSADVWGGDWPGDVGYDACRACREYECGGVNKPYSWKQCRLRGDGCFGHKAAHFDRIFAPVGYAVECSNPPFKGKVTAFDSATGQHTVTLEGGGVRKEYLAFKRKHVVVTRASLAGTLWGTTDAPRSACRSGGAAGAPGRCVVGREVSTCASSFHPTAAPKAKKAAAKPKVRKAAPSPKVAAAPKAGSARSVKAGSAGPMRRRGCSETTTAKAAKEAKR